MVGHIDRGDGVLRSHHNLPLQGLYLIIASKGFKFPRVYSKTLETCIISYQPEHT